MLLAVYRPGSQALTATFFDDLSAVFEQLAMFSCPDVICGDFNIHVDHVAYVNAVRLSQLLQSIGYIQHVTGLTHIAGHTLDLVITRSETDISNMCIGSMLSDHALVSFTMRVKKSRVDEQWVTSRAWRRLSHDAFTSHLVVSKLCTNTDELINLSVDDLVQLYRDVLTDLFDRHCPMVKVRRRVEQSTLWYDAEREQQKGDFAGRGLMMTSELGPIK